MTYTLFSAFGESTFNTESTALKNMRLLPDSCVDCIITNDTTDTTTAYGKKNGRWYKVTTWTDSKTESAPTAPEPEPTPAQQNQALVKYQPSHWERLKLITKSACETVSNVVRQTAQRAKQATAYIKEQEEKHQVLARIKSTIITTAKTVKDTIVDTLVTIARIIGRLYFDNMIIINSLCLLVVFCDAISWIGTWTDISGVDPALNTWFK